MSPFCVESNQSILVSSGVYCHIVEVRPPPPTDCGRRPPWAGGAGGGGNFASCDPGWPTKSRACTRYVDVAPGVAVLGRCPVASVVPEESTPPKKNLRGSLGQDPGSAYRSRLNEGVSPQALPTVTNASSPAIMSDLTAADPPDLETGFEGPQQQSLMLHSPAPQTPHSELSALSTSWTAVTQNSPARGSLCTALLPAP